jgi:hypothetical protein
MLIVIKIRVSYFSVCFPSFMSEVVLKTFITMRGIIKQTLFERGDLLCLATTLSIEAFIAILLFDSFPD